MKKSRKDTSPYTMKMNLVRVRLQHDVLPHAAHFLQNSHIVHNALTEKNGRRGRVRGHMKKKRERKRQGSTKTVR